LSLFSDEHPVEVTSFDTPGDAEGIFVYKVYLFVADGDSGLRILDISNPANPVKQGIISLPVMLTMFMFLLIMLILLMVVEV